MRDFIIKVLDDEDGISDAAYEQLLAVAEYCGDWNDDYTDIIAKIQSANGRYYLPEDHGLN